MRAPEFIPVLSFYPRSSKGKNGPPLKALVAGSRPAGGIVSSFTIIHLSRNFDNLFNAGL